MNQTSMDDGDGLDPNARQSEQLPRRGPAGDVQPNYQDPDPRTRGGQPPEDVEDRGTVGSVEPDDYPEKDRRDSRPDGPRPADHPADQAPAEGDDDLPPPTRDSPGSSPEGK